MIKSNNNSNYPCTLYIVRHGETNWNVMGRIQGQSDSELTEKGIQDTKILARRLKDIHFDAIFSSDLSRASKTAELIRLDRDLAIETHEALRERTFGIHDGDYSSDYTLAIQDLLKEYETLSVEEK